MCEDDCNLPPAPSTGDLVAVIKIGQEKSYHCDSISPSNWRLRLSNSKVVTQGETEILFDVKPDWWQGPLNLLIHEYGVLRGETNLFKAGVGDNFVEGNPIMHQFLLDPHKADIPTAGRILGFDVGPMGIIGRAISIESEGKVVGEGIIGWL